jgi:hypothetical protein
MKLLKMTQYEADMNLFEKDLMQVLARMLKSGYQ